MMSARTWPPKALWPAGMRALLLLLALLAAAAGAAAAPISNVVPRTDSAGMIMDIHDGNTIRGSDGALLVL